MQKKKYTAPEVEIIQLDSEISLALESNPPVYPGENVQRMPKIQPTDPFNGSYLV